jgi:hypothetical protein
VRARRSGLRARLAIALTLLVSPAIVRAQSAHPSFPVTDGQVHALAISGNTLYVGGEFNLIGTPNGGGAPVDGASGNLVPGFPQVHGAVYIAIDDGAGGWFIAGGFDRVGDQPRANLARIRADLSLDSWNPGSNGPVYGLALDGPTLYAAGMFTALGGQPHSRLAAVDVGSGSASQWIAGLDSTVYAIILAGDRLYLGGAFTTVEGERRHHLAAIDLASGGAAPWTSDADASVLCLAAADGVLYAGGDFMHVAGVTRHHIAAVDLATGALTAWNGTADGPVRALAVSRGKVYAGGDFTKIGGHPRAYIAALSTRWWQAVNWNPGANGTVHSLCVHGDRVFAGGVFTAIGGQTRWRAAILDTVGGQVTDWTPRVNGPVLAFAPVGTRVYVGGAFSNIGGQVRHRLAAIDRTTEQVTPWNPDADHAVYAIAPRGDVIYVGGHYIQRVGGQSRPYVAAVDSASGLVYPWSLKLTGSAYHVWALAVSDDRVYIGCEKFPHVAAVDAATGQITYWTRNVTALGSISSLALPGGRLFIAGWFDSLGYGGFLMLDPATGEIVRAYDSLPRQSTGLTVTEGHVYMCGRALAAVDVATGDVLPWGQLVRPCSGGWAQASVGRRVYTGGSFSTLGGQPRSRLAAVDAETGTLLGWNPGTNSWVNALAAADGVVYAGGNFTSVNGELVSYLAAIDDPEQLLDVPILGPASSLPQLGPSLPNPFSGSTVIRFDLSRAAVTSLDLVDVMGRRVRRVLTERAMPAGPHELTLRRDGLTAGIYWMHLFVDGRPSARKVVVLP